MCEVKQKRKKSPKGERTQKMFSFRLDVDLVEFLESQPNKGRYLNDLLRVAMGGSGGEAPPNKSNCLSAICP